jgi:hypothetical protein
METLLLNLKNDVGSHQIFMRKTREEKKLDLMKKIGVLKIDFENNLEQITTYERDLDRIVDAEIRAELEGHRSYDILNTEKMCPRFLNLCKASKKTASLDSVVNSDGQPFLSEAARDNYIMNFYQNIYTPAQGNNILEANCIENFLGENICNSQIVLESKLTGDESLFFD